jgi:ATP-binding cassette subfamily B protein
MNHASGWRIVGSYVRQNWPVYLVGTGLVALASLLAALVPRLIGRITDRLQHGGITTREMAVFVGLICLIGVVRVAAGWSGRIIVHRRGRILTYRLRKQLFEKWSTLSPAYYHRHSVGDMLSHALSDVEMVRDLVSQGFNMGFSGLAMLGGAICLMVVYVDWRLTLVGMGPLLVIPLLVKWLGPRIRKQSQRSQEALGAMAQTVEEIIGGIRAVKAFGTEQVVIKRFEERVDLIVEEKMRFARVSSLFGALVPLMVNLGFIIVLGYGGLLVSRKAITLGDFVAFTLYVAMLRMPLEQLGNVLNIVQRASASLRRIDELLNVVPAVRDRQGPLSDKALDGALCVEGLSFQYPGTEREVLRDISFSVKPGQTLGIIGGMGSGKSTLTNLLLRMYEPPKGTVFIGGCDILNYPLARLRDGIAYVPQDGFLFSTSLLENITFCDEQPDQERAEGCARITAVHDTIVSFSDGYETEIGERGVRLSGGQKQRIAIARMIYKDAPFQILDDSLSAVDTTTERQILHNLREVGKQHSASETEKARVTIVISHRLSAVQYADEILVLDEGRIIERGRHSALIAQCGVYAQQWYLQSGEVPEDDSTPYGHPQDGELLVEGMESLEADGMEDAA